jgi:hypothetical protein
VTRYFRVKDNSFQKIAADRVKLPQAETVMVERLPNSSTQNYVFLMASYLSASKTTFLYLVEIPSSLSVEQVRPTFIGSCAILSKPPLILGERRFMLISEVENSEIIEVVEDKTNDPRRPYMRCAHKFDNFGIVQQIEVDKERKSIVLNSFKSEGGLQQFQKGLQLEVVSRLDLVGLPSTRVLLIQPTEKYPMASFVFVQQSESRVMHMGQGGSLYEDRQLRLESEVIYFQPVSADIYIVVSANSLKLMQLWGPNQNLISDLAPPAEQEFTSCDSFHEDVVATTDKLLLFFRYNTHSNSLQKEHEIKLESEPRFVRVLYRRVLVAYWLEGYIDSYTLAGLGHWRIGVETKGVESLCFMYGKAEESILLLGTSTGETVVKVFGRDRSLKLSQTLQIGKGSVQLREVSLAQFVAISDESSVISLTGASHSVEVLPLCHSDLKDLAKFTHKSEEYFMLVGEGHVSVSKAKTTALDNYRLKEMLVTSKKHIDKVLSVSEMTITCSTDVENAKGEICVYSTESGQRIASVELERCLIESAMIIPFQDNSYLLIGMAIPEEVGEGENGCREEGLMDGSDNQTGRVKVYQLRGGNLTEVVDMAFDKPVRSAHKLEGSQILLCIGLSTLAVYRVESRMRKGGDRTALLDSATPQLKEVYKQKLYFLIDSVTVLDNYILITDFYWMAHVMLFENPRFPRFKAIGRLTGIPQEIIGAELLSPTRFVVSDRGDNLVVYSLAENGSSDVDFIEFADKNSICLGEKIMSFRRGSRQMCLHFTDPFFEDIYRQAKLPFVVMGGCSGGVYVMYEIPRKAYNLLEDLQSALLAEREGEFSLCLKRRDFRRVNFKNKKTKQSGGFIDGDVLLPLIHMEDGQALAILSKMKHVNKPSLSEIRNLLRFFENSPAG